MLMIEAKVGTITRPQCQVIVNAANGIGVMGKGVAGAISTDGGVLISEEAKALVKKRGKPFEAGDVYATGPGKLSRRSVKKIYHAVTMQYPGGLTSIHTVNTLMHKLLKKAIEDKMNSIAIPGLGTGIGRLDRNAVASVMVNVAQQYDHMVFIKFLDHSKIFIEEIKSLFGEDE